MIKNLHKKLKDFSGEIVLDKIVDTKNIYIKSGHYLKNLLDVDVNVLNMDLIKKKFLRSSLYISSGCSLAALTYLIKYFGFTDYEVNDVEDLAKRKDLFDFDGMSDQGLMDVLKIFKVNSKLAFVKNAKELSRYLRKYFIIANIWAQYEKVEDRYYSDTYDLEGSHYVLITDQFIYQGKNLFSIIDSLSETKDNPWGYSGISFDAYDSIRYVYLADNCLIDNYGFCPANTKWAAGSVILVEKKRN